jgi:hypothetical protein
LNEEEKRNAMSAPKSEFLQILTERGYIHQCLVKGLLWPSLVLP